jgi:hypothetical protein
MRCGCLQCQLSSALELLHMGKVPMASRLIEQALREVRDKAARENTKPVRAPARARKRIRA